MKAIVVILRLAASQHVRKLENGAAGCENSLMATDCSGAKLLLAVDAAGQGQTEPAEYIRKTWLLPAS
ncbi:hypothetical protein SPTER_17850 [Sporomusa termitida]|uniref:Uncharacterized protein n=1 Tax=Sporomusa termitida TaxID=2377 RepID=A0A517DT17_9FIRM|nr:hypothetical protein SPTER_17850 [Sporomusa termitida]